MNVDKLKKLGLRSNTSLREAELLYAIVVELNDPDWSTFACLDHRFHQFPDEYQGHIWSRRALREVLAERKETWQVNVFVPMLFVWLLHWINLDIIAFLHLQFAEAHWDPRFMLVGTISKWRERLARIIHPYCFKSWWITASAPTLSALLSALLRIVGAYQKWTRWGSLFVSLFCHTSRRM